MSADETEQSAVMVEPDKHSSDGTRLQRVIIPTAFPISLL